MSLRHGLPSVMMLMDVAVAVDKKKVSRRQLTVHESHTWLSSRHSFSHIIKFIYVILPPAIMTTLCPVADAKQLFAFFLFIFLNFSFAAEKKFAQNILCMRQCDRPHHKRAMAWPLVGVVKVMDVFRSRHRHHRYFRDFCKRESNHQRFGVF